jgi:PTS system cellobiose-specific IIC component
MRRRKGVVMSSFLSRLEKPLLSSAARLGRQPHLNAIRDGVVGALPLILIGSLFMLIAQPPLGSDAAMAAYMAHPFVPKLLVAFQMLVGLVGVYVAFGVAHSLAKRYDLDSLSAGLLAAAALFIANGMMVVAVPDLPKPLKMVPIGNLGSGGLFVAILLGLLVPEVQRLCKRFRIEIRMPDGVPPAVGRSFSALIPGVIILGGLWALTQLGGVDIFKIVTTYLAGPVQKLSEVNGTTASALIVYGVMLAVILLDSVLWLLGIHAVAILAPMQAVWLANITANAGGAHLLHTRESLQFFIWVGGSGATVVLPFLLLRSRDAALRAIAKVGLVPALFNINEPLIFGVPIMLNPTLVIPFILAPIVTLTTTVICTSLGWVPVAKLVVPWTLPGPIGAYLATGGHWQAALLSLVNIALAALIYWPFVRALERRAKVEEASAELASPTVPEGR